MDKDIINKILDLAFGLDNYSPGYVTSRFTRCVVNSGLNFIFKSLVRLAHAEACLTAHKFKVSGATSNTEFDAAGFRTASISEIVGRRLGGAPMGLMPMGLAVSFLGNGLMATAALMTP